MKWFCYFTFFCKCKCFVLNLLLNSYCILFLPFSKNFNLSTISFMTVSIFLVLISGRKWSNLPTLRDRFKKTAFATDCCTMQSNNFMVKIVVCVFFFWTSNTMEQQHVKCWNVLCKIKSLSALVQMGEKHMKNSHSAFFQNIFTFICSLYKRKPK